MYKGTKLMQIKVQRLFTSSTEHSSSSLSGVFSDETAVALAHSACQSENGG